jgi:NADPH-dependent F420 reductase
MPLTVSGGARMCKARAVRIGIMGGTGPAGSGLALRLDAAGYGAVVGSRSVERSREVVERLAAAWPGRSVGVVAGTNADAAACDLVVLATPWDSAATLAAEHAGLLAGKIVVTMANALVRVGNEFQPLVPPRGSIAAHVQAAIPASRVVAAMQHIPAKELGNLDHHVDSDVLVCSDDPEATETVCDVVSRIPGCRPLNTGGLSNALALEAFTAVLLQLNVRYKTRVAPRFTGIPAVDPVTGRDTTIRH